MRALVTSPLGTARTAAASLHSSCPPFDRERKSKIASIVHTQLSPTACCSPPQPMGIPPLYTVYAPTYTQATPPHQQT